MMLVGGFGLSIEFRWDGSRFRCPRSPFKEFPRKGVTFLRVLLGGGDSGLGSTSTPTRCTSARVDGSNNPPRKLPRLKRVADFTHDGDDADGSGENRQGFQGVLRGDQA